MKVVRSFLAFKPLVFKGNGVPNEAEFQIYQIDKVFERLEVTSTQKCCWPYLGWKEVLNFDGGQCKELTKIEMIEGLCGGLHFCKCSSNKM